MCTDSEHISFIVWTPAHTTKSQGHTIIFNHGLQGHKEWFYKFGEKLSKSGYTVYAFDRLGSGKSSGIKGHIESWKSYTLTLDKMVQHARSEHPNNKISLWGSSYGGNIVTAYLQQYQNCDEFEAAVLITPGPFRNKKELPLPFKRIKLYFSRNKRYFPSPVTDIEGDRGANFYTSKKKWQQKITNDPFSLRMMTRKFYLETNKMNRFIASKNSLKIKRFYLLVGRDSVMNNIKLLTYMRTNPSNTSYKIYRGGDDEKHVIEFTEDSKEAISDITYFLNGDDKEIQNIKVLLDGR